MFGKADHWSPDCRENSAVELEFGRSAIGDRWALGVEVTRIGNPFDEKLRTQMSTWVKSFVRNGNMAWRLRDTRSRLWLDLGIPKNT